LIFPHHEDEIAQSEGATGQPFVKYWLHGAHLLVEGKKMSKSLGNFFTLRDLLAKGFTGREIRYLLLTAHYRETFNFTMDGLAGAKTALARIDECTGKLRELSGTPNSRSARTDMQLAGRETGVPNLIADFTAAMDDDMNISAAWAVVFDWVRDMNRRLAENSLSAAEAATALTGWEKIDSVLGIGTKSGAEVPAEILVLTEARMAAKQAKDFKRADAIRGELKAKGWVIEDTPKGPKLKKI
jgi:cysteinyl-tRNA synthetase